MANGNQVTVIDLPFAVGVEWLLLVVLIGRKKRQKLGLTGVMRLMGRIHPHTSVWRDYSQATDEQIEAGE